MRALALLIGPAALLAGCASGNAPRTQAGAVRPASASCAAQHELAAAPLPGEVGVYRAGPLTLVVGEDLAQSPAASGKTILVLDGDRPTVLSVDPRSRVRATLYYSSPRDPALPPTIDNGQAAVRFPACGQWVHRFGGGIVFAGTGCARLRVKPAGLPPRTMLVPVGNSLRGCPVDRRALDLRPAAIMVGLACPQRQSWCANRIGIAVEMSGPSMLLTAQLAGRLVTLRPPERQHANTWLGYLLRAPGRLISAASGICCPQARVRVTAFFATGAAAAMTARVPVSAGF